MLVTTKTANEKNFVNPAHGDIPTAKYTNHREDHYDDKVEEIWITSLSNACYSRNAYMLDRTNRPCPRGKSTIKLLSKVFEQILSMRWHHYSLL